MKNNRFENQSKRLTVNKLLVLESAAEENDLFEVQQYILKAILVDMPNNKNALLKLSNISYANNDYIDTLHYSGKYIEAGGVDFRVFFQYAEALRFNNQFTVSEKYYDLSLNEISLNHRHHRKILMGSPKFIILRLYIKKFGQ
mgnify:CR=1 FL=1